MVLALLRTFYLLSLHLKHKYNTFFFTTFAWAKQVKTVLVRVEAEKRQAFASFIKLQGTFIRPTIYCVLDSEWKLAK